MRSFYLVATLALTLVTGSRGSPSSDRQGHGAAGAAHDETIEQLRAKLTSPKTKSDERCRLVEQIAALGTDEAFALLREQLDREPGRGVRRAIFSALLDGDEASLEILREAGLDADPFLRAHSLAALEAVEPEEAAERARDILLYDEDARVRQSAIELLGRALDPDRVSFLLEVCSPLALEEQRIAVRVLSRFAGIDEVLKRQSAFWAEAASDPPRRLLATLVLAARAGRKAKGLLQALARDEDQRVAAAAALGIDRLRGQGTGSSIKRLLARTRDADERQEVLDVVGRCGLSDPGLLEILRAELRQRDWRLRALAAEALGESLGSGHSGSSSGRGSGATKSEPASDVTDEDAAEGLQSLTTLLVHEKIWQVRVAAIRALGASRRGAAIEALIGFLEEARGRERVECALALGRLTGMSLGRSAATWRRWWSDHAGDFVPPPPDVARWVELAAPDQRYAFYGLDVESERVCFALDVSGSMQGRPIQVLREQLVQVIRGMPEQALFNMVFFEGTVRRWNDTLVPLTPKTRQEALVAVRYLEANGGTNMWGALQACLEDDRVDSVFLLSDGQPTAGEIQDVATICARLTARNRHRRIAFHVVLIGYTSEPLRKLATSSGGSYIEVNR